MLEQITSDKTDPEIIRPGTYSNSGIMYNYAIHKKPDGFEEYYFSLPTPAIFLDLMRNRYRAPTILDLGSGRGVESDRLRTLIPSASIISLDISSIGTKSAKKEFDLHQIQADINHPPIVDNSFDGIHCKDVLIHVPDKRQLAVDISRMLKREGYFLLDSSIVAYTSFIQYPWEPEEFVAIASQMGLDLIQWEQVEMRLDDWYEVRHPRTFMLFKAR